MSLGDRECSFRVRGNMAMEVAARASARLSMVSLDDTGQGSDERRTRSQTINVDQLMRMQFGEFWIPGDQDNRRTSTGGNLGDPVRNKWTKKAQTLEDSRMLRGISSSRINIEPRKSVPETHVDEQYLRRWSPEIIDKMRAQFMSFRYWDVSLKELVQTCRHLERMVIVLNWLDFLLPTALSDRDLAVSLRDGYILCRFAIRIKPGSIGFIQNVTDDDFACAENVCLFLSACRNAFALPPHKLFCMDDLLLGRGMVAVVRCLHSLGCKLMKEETLSAEWAHIFRQKQHETSMANDKLVSIAVRHLLPILSGCDRVK